jgi:NitT/TauT family transport system substrate-binding protein
MPAIRSRRVKFAASLTVAGLAAIGLAGCSSSDASSGSSKATTIRLGYFPNLTHGTALVGLREGIFAESTQGKADIKARTFSAGPQAVEALNSGAIDATFIGPGPSINAFVKARGQNLVVVSGAASGGACLVVKPQITSAAQLKGKKIATPSLGNTQDIALRHWAKTQGWKTTTEGTGDIKITPTENATVVNAWQSGAIDAAWEPEPYASKLVAAGGHVLFDEASLWPAGKFATTILVVRKKFLAAHRDAVAALITAVVKTNDWIAANSAKAKADVNASLGELTGKPLPDKVIDSAWQRLRFTDDPIVSSIKTDFDQAKDVGFLKEDSTIDGLLQLDLLNQALKSAGKPEIIG